MEAPLISVIVPAYNAKKYLPACVASVQRQEHQNWELLLIDDGSTDGSGALCDELAAADGRVKPHHQQNAGVSAARNAGIVRARGEYVMFLDADDELMPGCMTSLLDALRQTGADIAAGKSTQDSFAWNHPQSRFVWNGEEGVSGSLGDHPLTYSAWGKLYRRAVIGDTRFRRDIRINEDSFFLFCLLCKQPRFVGMDQVIYRYNVVPTGASRAAFSEKYFDIFRVADLKYEIIQRDFPALLGAAQNMRLKAWMNMLELLAACPGRKYRDLEKELLCKVRAARGSYVSATRRGDLWLFVLTHGLYYPYRFAYQLIKRAGK